MSERPVRQSDRHRGCAPTHGPTLLVQLLTHKLSNARSAGAAHLGERRLVTWLGGRVHGVAARAAVASLARLRPILGNYAEVLEARSLSLLRLESGNKLLPRMKRTGWMLARELRDGSR